MNVTGKTRKPTWNLRLFLEHIAVRGECICGKCKNGEHTVDLVFMKVSVDKWTSNSTFQKLVQAEYPELLNCKVKSLHEVTEIVGDQEFALITMGIGKLLGVWELETPDTMVKNLSQKHRLQLAQNGKIFIRVPRASNSKPRRSCHVASSGVPK